MDDMKRRDLQNAQITRTTNQHRHMAQAEDRRIAAQLRRYRAETAAYFKAAANLDGEAVNHLRNRDYTMREIAEATGQTEEALAQVRRTYRATLL